MVIEKLFPRASGFRPHKEALGDQTAKQSSPLGSAGGRPCSFRLHGRPSQDLPRGPIKSGRRCRAGHQGAGWVRLLSRVRPCQQSRPPEPGLGGPPGDEQGQPSVVTGRRVCSPPHAAVLFLADLLEGQVRACCAKKLLVTPWVLMNPSIVKYTEGAVTSNVRHM